MTTPVIQGCACLGCEGLRLEAGEHAALLSRKLPIRGWAGTFSEAEKLFLRYHPPEWYRLALARKPGLGSTPRAQTRDTAEDVCVEDIEDAAWRCCTAAVPLSMHNG
jgi:hypothetical protein